MLFWGFINSSKVCVSAVFSLTSLNKAELLIHWVLQCALGSLEALRHEFSNYATLVDLLDLQYCEGHGQE